MLTKYVSQNQRDWDECLPLLLLASRSSVHDITKQIPYIMFFGRHALLRSICCVVRRLLFVCSGLASLSMLSVISRRCLVVTGSSMLTFIVLPHCGIRSQTLLPDTTSSHIILTPERPVLALPRKSECQAGSN